MKAYRFRLDSVLRVRQLQERVAAQQLAVAVRDLHGARTELARARRSLDGPGRPRGPAHGRRGRSGSTRSPSRMSETARASGRRGGGGRGGGAAGHAGVGERPAAHGNARATGRAPRGAVAGRVRPERSGRARRPGHRAEGAGGSHGHDHQPGLVGRHRADHGRTAAVAGHRTGRLVGLGGRRRRRQRRRLRHQPGPGDRIGDDAAISSPMPSPPMPTLRRTTSRPRSALRPTRPPIRSTACTSGVGSSGSESELLALLVAALGNLAGSSEETGALEQGAADRRQRPRRPPARAV